MNDVVWNDAALREFVRVIETRQWWNLDDDAREERRAQFRAQLAVRIVPAVQRQLLSTIGMRADAAGVAIIADEIVDDGAYFDERRWLLVSQDPWGYFAEWVAIVIERSYAGALRVPLPPTPTNKKLERALKR